MPSDTTERVLSEAQIEEVRGLARTAIAESRLTHADAAREAGIAYATFSAFMGGSYAGRNDRIAETVQRWLRSRADREATIAAAPRTPGFIVTPTAEAVMLVLRQAKHMPDFAVITGPPGIGKTMAACRYMRETPNVWKITAHPSLNSPRHVLKELANELGAPSVTMLQLQHQAVVKKLRGIEALLIVDEAQHLTSAALDQLRSIHDAAECGLALLGNSSVYGRLEGGSRSTEFAQLFSRVGVRLKATPKAADADTLMAEWGVEDAQQRGLLRAIAKKPGALRQMTKTLRLAHLLASAERAPLAISHLKMAYEQLSDTKLAGEA